LNDENKMIATQRKRSIEQGKVRHLARAYFDITDTKPAKNILSQSEDIFSKAFHFNPDPIAITDLKDGRYIIVNEAYLMVAGYKRHEIIGRAINEIAIFEDLEERDYILKQVRMNGVVRDFEVKLRSSSGAIIHALISAKIIEIDGIPHLLTVGKNITQRKQVEKALCISEERFYKAFNASPIIMAITSLLDGRFIEVNNSFSRMIGYSCEEVQGRTSLEIGFWLNPDDRSLAIQKLINDGSLNEMEIRFGLKTGQQRLGLYSAEPLNINGESCILSIVTDITEHRQMETDILRMDRLNLVGEMAASIGHEIRNPMTSVRGFLQIFKDKYSEDREFLNLMIEELDRANLIITEFLSLAKNKTVELEEINLNAVITNIHPLLQANAVLQDKNVLLELENIPKLLVDGKEIRQLILNLVQNGMESMSSGGNITIRTFSEKNMVVLSIQDQGKGINPEVLNKLGTPFLTTKDQGTGLGLAVCYNISKRYNAKIDIKTGADGTTFSVRFPHKFQAKTLEAYHVIST